MLTDSGYSAMMEPFIGEIREFVGDTPPAGWALCDGQILQINEHRTLFALLGSQFGGDGRWTFALPALTGSHRQNVPNKVARNRRENETGTTRSADPSALATGPRRTRFIISLDGLAPHQ